jgi:uncharacterized repeat protein (TIGR01451 family)
MEARCVPSVTVTPHYGSDGENPVLTHVEVQTLFYGTEWQSDPSLLQDIQTINSFFNYITNSPYMDMLSEYYETLPLVGNQYVGRGRWTGASYVNDNGESAIDDSTIQQLLADGIIAGIQSNGASGLPDHSSWETVYFVYLPPNIVDSEAQQNHWGAYHSGFKVPIGTEPGPGGTITIYSEVTYVVVPWPVDGNTGDLYPINSPATTQWQEIYSSHELSEGVTNPSAYYSNTGTIDPTIFGSSWYAEGWQFVDGQNREIGDLCEKANEKYGYYNGYWVQAEWSNLYTDVNEPGTNDHRILPAGTQNIWMQPGGNGQGIFPPNDGTVGHGFGEDPDPLGANMPTATSLPTYSLDPGQVLTVFTSQGVLTPFSDPNHLAMEAELQSGPAHGQLALNPNGSFTYTPAPGFSGTDSFQVYVFDGEFYSNPVTIHINVLPPALGSLSTREWPVNQSGYGATIPITFGSGIYSNLHVTGLPAGLVALLLGNTVVLGGTPKQAGTFSNIVVSLQDNTGASASANYTLVIDPPLTPTILVTTASDATGHTGESLRDAVTQADSDAAQGRSDTIGFAATLAGQTITLVQGQLDLSGTGTITIDGSGEIAVSGNNAGLVFQVESGAQVVLSGLTITKGGIANGSAFVETGGNLSLKNCTISGNSGIYSNGTLTVVNCVISGNSSPNAGGIWNDGTATVTDSTISGNTATFEGGGIANLGDWALAHLTMSNCTIGDNSAGSGGGIENGGYATLTGCTISCNSAGSGGGIDNNGGILTLVDTTVSDNSATDSSKGAGGISISDAYSTVTAINCTMAANSTAGKGGGIYNGYPNNPFGSPSAALTLSNTIVAGNYAASAPDVDTKPTSGITVTATYSLIGNTTSSGITGGTGNILNPISLGLGGLGNYGGPTQTMALGQGSPAIDAGDPNAVPGATDQRGYARIVGGGVDIGAYEYVATKAAGDLAVTVKGATEAVPGDTYVVTVTVINHGGTAQADVTLAGILPANTTLASWSTSASGWTLSAPAAGQTGSVSAWTSSLAKGASASFTLELRVNANTAAVTLIDTTLSVGPTTGDPKPANNSATWPTTVVVPTPLAGTSVQVQQGSLSYDATTHKYVETLTLTNTSGSPLSGPISLLVEPGPQSNFTVTNATGILGDVPFVSLVHKGKTWKAGQKLTITLAFTAASAQDIAFQWSVEEGVGP